MFFFIVFYKKINFKFQIIKIQKIIFFLVKKDCVNNSNSFLKVILFFFSEVNFSFLMYSINKIKILCA